MGCAPPRPSSGVTRRWSDGRNAIGRIDHFHLVDDLLDAVDPCDDRFSHVAQLPVRNPPYKRQHAGVETTPQCLQKKVRALSQPLLGDFRRCVCCVGKSDRWLVGHIRAQNCCRTATEPRGELWRETAAHATSVPPQHCRGTSRAALRKLPSCIDRIRDNIHLRRPRLSVGTPDLKPPRLVVAGARRREFTGRLTDSPPPASMISGAANPIPSMSK